MYYSFSEKIFYALSIAILLMGGFVLETSGKQDVAIFQNQIRNELATATVETFGDQIFFGELGLIWSGVNDFYNQAAVETIALLSQPETDEDLVKVADRVVALIINTVKGPSIEKDSGLVFGPDFMTQEPVYSLVPENFEFELAVSESPELLDQPTARVAGVSIISQEAYEDTKPVNEERPWVTMKDNHTGQIYCVAVYNGEVNKYLGGCKYDYE